MFSKVLVAQNGKGEESMACDLGFRPSDNPKYYFLSYNSEDADRVSEIARQMIRSGIELWYDKGIEYGEKWERTIAEKIYGCQAVILFFTSRILNKEEPFVEKEYKMARVYRKKVYVVMMDEIDHLDVPTSKMFWWNEITELQCIEAHVIDDSDTVAEEIISALNVNREQGIVDAQNDSYKTELRSTNDAKKLTETQDYEGNIDDRFKDVTGNYDNKCVLIYSLAAKCFASARLDLNDIPVCCSTNNQDAWEIFQVAVDKEGWASFKAVNGSYLTVRLDVQRDLPPIRATATSSRFWEQFKIYKIVDKYAIFSRCNGQWITSRIDREDNPLYASRADADSWEMFEIRTVM